MKTYYIVRSTDNWQNHKYMDVDDKKARPKYWNKIDNATKFKSKEEAIERVNKSKAVGLKVLKIEEVYIKEEK